MGQYMQAMVEALPDDSRSEHAQLLQQTVTGSPPEEAGRLFTQLLFPSAAAPPAQAGSALAAPPPVRDKAPRPAPGSGGPQPVGDVGQAPVQMHALALAAAAVSQAGGDAVVYAVAAPPAAEQACASASGLGFTPHSASHNDVQGLPDAAAAEHGAAGERVSPLRRLVVRPRSRARALRGRTQRGAANEWVSCMTLVLTVVCVTWHQQCSASVAGASDVVASSPL